MPEEEETKDIELIDQSTLTAIEKMEFSAKLSQLKYKRQRYLEVRLSVKLNITYQTIEKALLKFDEDLENLAQNRILLDSDLKFADIKLLLLHREWVLLKEFEKYDTKLAEKLLLKKQEKSDIDEKVFLEP